MSGLGGVLAGVVGIDGINMNDTRNAPDGRDSSRAAPQSSEALRILVVGAFAGGAPPPPAPVPVTADGFAALFASLAPRIVIPHTAALSPEPGKRLGARSEPQASGVSSGELELVFRAWSELAPAGLVGRVPALAALAELRERVRELARDGVGVDALRAEIRARVAEPVADVLEAALGGDPAQAETAAPDADSGVDAILTRVSAPAHTARHALGPLLAGARPRAAGAAARALEEALDARIAAGLDALLRAPELRSLEAAWRGLRLLVERTDFRRGVELWLLCAPLDAAPEALRAAPGEFDCILADYALDASPRDLLHARALAEAAEELQTPLVTALAPAFFGLGSWAELEKARPPHASFEDAAYDGWRALRSAECARWLCLVANRIALRAAYGPDGAAARGLAYTEQGEGAGLLGSPVWAVGALLARAFARSGQCIQISGPQHGLVHDLALLAPAAGGAPVPVEGVFHAERRAELERIGIAAVQHYQRDIAVVGALRCFRAPDRFADAEASADAAQQVALAYQLFASRLVKFVARLLPELAGAASADALVGALRERLQGFLSAPGAAFPAQRIGVAAQVAPEDPGRAHVKLRVAPELKIAGRDVHVMMQFAARL
jgi:type VI secretion system protein ImpC